jgi:hypothetical protein
VAAPDEALDALEPFEPRDAGVLAGNDALGGWWLHPTTPSTHATRRPFFITEE